MTHKTQQHIQQEIVDARIKFEMEHGSPNYLYLGNNSFLNYHKAIETGFFIHYQGKSYDCHGFWTTPSQTQCMHAIVCYDENLTTSFEWRL